MEFVRRKVARRRSRLTMLPICVVYEASADAEIATDLADRVILEQITWLADEPSLLQYEREYRLKNGTESFRWDNIDNLARKVNIRVRGKFGSEPAEPDAKAARRAILAIQKIMPDARALILMRDSDQDSARRTGLEQARTEHANWNSGLTVIVGLAATKRECWVLTGFIAMDNQEKKLIESERQNLGFNPCEKSHRLTAKHDEVNDKRHAKRVLSKFTGNNPDRERDCWITTPLASLRKYGSGNGLKDYLAEVERYLVPLIGQGTERMGG